MLKVYIIWNWQILFWLRIVDRESSILCSRAVVDISSHIRVGKNAAALEKRVHNKLTNRAWKTHKKIRSSHAIRNWNCDSESRKFRFFYTYVHTYVSTVTKNYELFTTLRVIFAFILYLRLHWIALGKLAQEKSFIVDQVLKSRVRICYKERYKEARIQFTDREGFRLFDRISKSYRMLKYAKFYTTIIHNKYVCIL